MVYVDNPNPIIVRSLTVQRVSKMRLLFRSPLPKQKSGRRYYNLFNVTRLYRLSTSVCLCFVKVECRPADGFCCRKLTADRRCHHNSITTLQDAAMRLYRGGAEMSAKDRIDDGMLSKQGCWRWRGRTEAPANIRLKSQGFGFEPCLLTQRRPACFDSSPQGYGPFVPRHCNTMT